MIDLLPILSLWEMASFSATSFPASASQARSECPERREKRPSKQVAFAASLRHRRCILSRSSSESTSGPSKSLETRRKPPSGKRVIFNGVSSTTDDASRKNRKRTKKTSMIIDMYAMARFSSSTPLNGAEAVIPIAMAVAERKFC